MGNPIRVWGEGRTGLWSPDGGRDIPDDYQEVPTGDPYITRLLKESVSTVYVRMEKRGKSSVPVGILAPREVVEVVRAAAERTAPARAARQKEAAAARAKREAVTRQEAVAQLEALFPRIPAHDAESIVRRAFEVSSGRVGRSRSLEMRKKLELAVQAHIRHRHTHYDRLLAAEYDREEARDEVSSMVETMLSRWRGDVSDER